MHVRNLNMLGGGTKGQVELFERGYGKDAAGIAKEAITHGEPNPAQHWISPERASVAKDNNFEVVLIDTAGRMQDNEVGRPVISFIHSLLIVFVIPASHASSS